MTYFRFNATPWRDGKLATIAHLRGINMEGSLAVPLCEINDD
jgi:hypothetical protein